MAIPQKIDRYEILSKIAGGGMAVVYLARDPRVGRQVAVKVLYEHLAQDEQIRERFKREAETIATLEHPAIVPLYDFGEEDDSLYLVMRYMQGGTLASRMKDGGMDLPEIVPVIRRVGAALTEAHRQNIVHRDLKPGNILFDHTDQAYLSDFGIARLLEATMTATDAMMGTPAYMSPEQVRGPKEVDYRSDIYGLGVILFEMLTGQRPFTGDTPLEQATARILYPPPHLHDFNVALPEGWDWVIQKALAQDKTQRYQSVAALVADVEAVADGRIPTTAVFPVTTEAASLAATLGPPPLPTTIPSAQQPETPIKPGAGGPIPPEPPPAPPPAAGPRPAWWKWAAPAAGVLLLLLLAAVFLRGRAGEEVAGTTPTAVAEIVAEPTNTATMTATATNTAVSPTDTASPTLTSTPSRTPRSSRTPTAVPTNLPQLRLTRNANVRQGPGTAYATIATLQTGDVVTVLAKDRTGEWVNILLPDGRTGWLSLTGAEWVDPSLATNLPVAATIPPLTPVRATHTATAVPTNTSPPPPPPGATATPISATAVPATPLPPSPTVVTNTPYPGPQPTNTPPPTPTSLPPTPTLPPPPPTETPMPTDTPPPVPGATHTPSP